MDGLNGFEKELFDKIRNKEDLDFNELQYLERMLYIGQIWDKILNIQVGVSPNTLGLIFPEKLPNTGVSK